MSDTAFQKQYRQEFIAGFEQNMSLLRQSVTTEVQVKGNEAIFLVADSGDAEAVTRGVDGNIPGRADNLNQYTCTLVEYHDVPERTNFNIFASQGDGRRIMQKTSSAVINRRIDTSIINQLNTGTNNTGTAATASLALAIKAHTMLQNNDVPDDGNIFAVITPAFRGYLLQVPEFASADYVRKAPIDNGQGAWNDMPGYYDWMGVKWIVHPNLPGKGTSAEKCFMYHKSAIGHAAPSELIMSEVGYDRRHDKSWARHTTYEGAKLIQNSGLIVMNHDGSAFA